MCPEGFYKSHTTNNTFCQRCDKIPPEDLLSMLNKCGGCPTGFQHHNPDEEIDRERTGNPYGVHSSCVQLKL